MELDEDANLTYDFSAFINETAELEVEHDIMDQIWIRIILIVLYSIIFLLGTTGNLLVVYVVLRNKSMQTFTNILIMNLSVSDFMMCILAAPFTPASAFLGSWVFGEALCHIVPISLGISVYVSSLSCTAIAINRYLALSSTSRPRKNSIVCLLVLAAIWIVSILISLPLAIYQRLRLMHIIDEQRYICYERWPSSASRQYYTLSNLVLQYLVPCIIIAFCYGRIYFLLKNISNQNQYVESYERDIKKDRKINRMLILMMCIFIFCWLPLNVIHLASEYHHAFSGWKYFVITFFICHIIAMSSTIYNPFLYAWMNESFHKEFRKVVPCLFRRKHHIAIGDSATQKTSVPMMEKGISME